MDQNHDWRGRHLIRIPRAPKPEPAPIRGHVDADVKAAVFRMARDGKTCPEIARALDMKPAKVRHVLITEGVEFKLAKVSASGQRKR